ncbi:MAG: GNAT family N-acetyltransferase [Actinomycetota bacterium]
MEPLPGEVTTERLTLRRWRVGDVPILDEAVRVSLDHLLPWMAFAALEPLAADARVELIESWDDDWAAGGDAIYGAFADGAVVGGCGLHRRRGPTVLEIGYWIHVDHVRRGYATELARGLTDAAFTIDGIDRVEIHHDKANRWSGAVPGRLGFTAGPERPDEIVAPAEIGIDCTWFVDRVAWVDR